MTVRLKPLEEQVIVITGASSGIGLATARMAAERGARLVLVARNEKAVRDIAKDCSRRGGRAVAVPADVGRREDLARVAKVAVETFGGFDTWVNNAGAALYGAMKEIPIEDQRRQFEVNYWGVVNGSLIAAEHLRKRGGGAVINTGSILSDRTMIYQTQYSATKHAVKAFTDGLRMELEAEGAPISVTLIKPSSIDTPYPEHARNYLDAPALTLPPPAYDPAVVAKGDPVSRPRTRSARSRSGFAGYAITLSGAHFPRLTDRLMETRRLRLADDGRAGAARCATERQSLRAREDGDEHSSQGGRVAQVEPVSRGADAAGRHGGRAGRAWPRARACAAVGAGTPPPQRPRPEAVLAPTTRPPPSKGEVRTALMAAGHFAHRDQHVERPRPRAMTSAQPGSSTTRVVRLVCA
jgi:short-subunit dehydrogenase